jgi:hypothetical protein
VTDATYTGVTVQIGTRLNRLDETETVSAASPMAAEGVCPVFAEGRYVRGVVNIAAGTTWTEAVGVQTDTGVSGER